MLKMFSWYIAEKHIHVTWNTLYTYYVLLLGGRFHSFGVLGFPRLALGVPDFLFCNVLFVLFGLLVLLHGFLSLRLRFGGFLLIMNLLRIRELCPHLTGFFGHLQHFETLFCQ